MKRIIQVSLLYSFAICSLGQNIGETWMKYRTPEDAGWSSGILEKTYRQSNAASMMLIYDGKVVAAYGSYWRRFKCHSVRKSLLNSLYGIYVEHGVLDLSNSLKDLDINDVVPLTESEQSATVRDLLTSRSGIYLPSGQETQDMKDSRPVRGSHLPGTYYYYNNWDFNVLGTIFRQETGKDIFYEFHSRIAIPLQMEDFRIMDGTYDFEYAAQVHPAYPFKMSARDMARFGQLYLQKGEWNGKQVISRKWIMETLTPYSIFPDGTGYGYLWWIDMDFHGDTVYYASGYGGQMILIWPSRKIVLALNADTYALQQIYNRYVVIRDLLITARNGSAKPDPSFFLLEDPEPITSIELEEMERKRYIGAYMTGDTSFHITYGPQGLLLENYHYFYKFRLLPVAPGQFYIEDLDLYLLFSFDENNNPADPEFHNTNE